MPPAISSSARIGCEPGGADRRREDVLVDAIEVDLDAVGALAAEGHQHEAQGGLRGAAFRHAQFLHACGAYRTAFLRRVLMVDAATCIATGVLMSLFATPLSTLLGLPAALLFYAGASLFPIAAFMAWLALRRDVARWGAWLVILGNAGDLLLFPSVVRRLPLRRLRYIRQLEIGRQSPQFPGRQRLLLF